MDDQKDIFAWKDIPHLTQGMRACVKKHIMIVPDLFDTIYCLSRDVHP